MEKKETPQARFDRLNSKVYRLKVMTRTEQDIIQKLDSVPNNAGYKKAFIREYIEKQKKKTPPSLPTPEATIKRPNSRR